jgi:methylmalonyl-CoA carboxyltransferase large subunit
MSALATDAAAAVMEQMRQEIAELRARLEKLESGKAEPAAAEAAAAPAPVPVTAPPPPAPAVEEISPENLLVISAAVAAFLGERGHIKAVRLVGSARWAQQGRVSIQASHRLSRT